MPTTEPSVMEREAFLAWLRAYAGGGEQWRGNVLMGEHDIALALWNDRRREIVRLRTLLLQGLQALEYHRDQTRRISHCDAVIENLRVCLSLAPADPPEGAAS